MKNAVLVEHVWTREFCEAIRQAMNEGEQEAAEIIDGSIRVDTAARQAFDVTVSDAWIDRIEHEMRALWPRIGSFFAIEIGDAVGVTCVRYVAGGRYGRHRDRDPASGSGTEMRRASVVVFLNSGFDGGTLHLYPEDADPIAIIPEPGTLVAFPADWLHEVRPVTQGTRDVIVDWLS